MQQIFTLICFLFLREFSNSKSIEIKLKRFNKTKSLNLKILP
jgi:hypothetical protein